MDELAADDVCSLKSHEKHFGLHPIFLKLSLGEDYGNRHTVEWVTERCCPGRTYDRVQEAFEAFLPRQ